MGMTARALLVYGYAVGGDDGWQVAEAREYGEWTPDWLGDDDLITAAEQRLLASVGFTETDHKAEGYIARQAEAEARLGVRFVPYGYEMSCWSLTTHRERSEWGESVAVDFADLERQRVEGDWDGKLAAAVAALGCTPKQERPAWLLLAFYG